MSLIDQTVWDEWKNFEREEDQPGFFAKLLEAFLTSTPKLMEGLGKGFATQNFKEVHYFAHTLASSCRSLGANGLADDLKAVELAAKATPPVMKTDLLNPIQMNYKAVKKMIEVEFMHSAKAA
jgi:HPt (histidine-containing phosphotransfer) domain-containing protein